MKTYKGFNADMTCRGFQYEPGGEYEMDGKIKACERGFHGCEMPLDVLRYYAPGKGARYFAVEQDGEIAKDGDDSKIASSKIKIGAEIGLPGLIKAQVEWVKARVTTEHTDPKQATAGDSGAATAGSFGAATAGDSGAATAGDSGAATAGDSGAATAGDSGAATAGYRGAATAGSFGAATAGSFGAATAGDSGAATAGDSGAATAGYRGAATAGYRGAATSKGSASVGKNGIACVRGNGVKVRGGIGALLVIGVEQDDSYDLAEWRAVVVDGETIKAGTWYTLRDGELVEAE